MSMGETDSHGGGDKFPPLHSLLPGGQIWTDMVCRVLDETDAYYDRIN